MFKEMYDDWKDETTEMRTEMRGLTDLYKKRVDPEVAVKCLIQNCPCAYHKYYEK